MTRLLQRLPSNPHQRTARPTAAWEDGLSASVKNSHAVSGRSPNPCGQPPCGSWGPSVSTPVPIISFTRARVRLFWISPNARAQNRRAQTALRAALGSPPSAVWWCHPQAPVATQCRQAGPSLRKGHNAHPTEVPLQPERSSPADGHSEPKRLTKRICTCNYCKLK